MVMVFDFNASKSFIRFIFLKNYIIQGNEKEASSYLSETSLNSPQNPLIAISGFDFLISNHRQG